MLKSSINPKCQAFGDYSEQVSDTYKLMGSIHLSQGSIERALRAYKKVRHFKVTSYRGLTMEVEGIRKGKRSAVKWPTEGAKTVH